MGKPSHAAGQNEAGAEATGRHVFLAQEACMKTIWNLLALLGLVAALSGCTVTAAPMVYVPPPACPEGYYYASGYGCIPCRPAWSCRRTRSTPWSTPRGAEPRSCGSHALRHHQLPNVGEQVQVLSHSRGLTHVWALPEARKVASRYLN